MKNPCKQALIAAAVSLSVAIPQFAFAEATTVTGAGALSANARVDFQITIPGVLRFRVGSPAAAIDMITFAPTSANLGTGSISGTGGDLTGGSVTVDVLANAGGDVTISQDSNGLSLADGAGNTIPYTTIATASSQATLGAPALGTAGTTTVFATGNLVQESAEWTYTYANGASYPSGIYGGTVANNGRVTYTASSP